MTAVGLGTQEVSGGGEQLGYSTSASVEAGRWPPGTDALGGTDLQKLLRR